MGTPLVTSLSPDPTKSGPSISIQRQLDDDGDVQIYLFATIILADDLKNPDGSEHTDDRQTMYDMLLDFLGNRGHIHRHFHGNVLGLGQIGHTSTELHMVEASIFRSSSRTSTHTPLQSIVIFLWFTVARCTAARRRISPGRLLYGDKC